MTGQVNLTFEPDNLEPSEGEREENETETAHKMELGPVEEEDES